MATGTFWDSLSSIGDFLGSDSVQGAISLGMSGLEGYTGLQQFNQASDLASLSQSALEQRIALAQSNASRYNKLYAPIENLQAQYALEDIQNLRPLTQAQQEYGIERGMYDIARAKDFYQPLEEDLVNQLAQGVDAQEYMDVASADVQQAFDKAAQQQARQMQLSGVNPASAQYQQALGSTRTSQALGEAGARTAARRLAEDLDINRRASALQYAKGVPLNTTSVTGGSQLLGQAASGLGAVAGTSAASSNLNYGTAGDLLASSKYNLSDVSNYWGS